MDDKRNRAKSIAIIGFLAAVMAVTLAMGSCASGSSTTAGDPSPIPTPSPVQSPMPDDVSVIYLHHSTGGVIWGGGVPEALSSYVSTSGKAYQITDRGYPAESPYGWSNYPYDYWNIWVQNAGESPYLDEEPLELLTDNYEVIVFKHCFPVSNIGPDSGAPDVSSSAKSLENYYLQYEELKTKMHTFPDTRFIVWTGAANVSNYTSPEEAARARTFFTWVKNTWDEAGDNIYVWDFFELETEGGNVLLTGYAQDGNDSHPTGAFAERVAPLFVNRLVDVIEGRGDNGPIDGDYHN